VLAAYKRFQEEITAGALKAAAADPTVEAQLRGAALEQLDTLREWGVDVRHAEGVRFADQLNAALSAGQAARTARAARSDRPPPITRVSE
jgi:hypothetical protein